jgi:hypothetical protein
MAIAEKSQRNNAQNRLRGKIQSQDIGHVEARVEGRVVKYQRDGGFDGFSYDYPMPSGMVQNDIMEAVILEIAAGRGKTSGRPFSAKFARRMIEERRTFNRSFPGKHAEAAAVEALLETQPELFSA